MGWSVKLEEVFKNPNIRREAVRIRAQFQVPGADGHALYKEMEVLLINQGEWDFEQEVETYPYGLPVEGLGTSDFASQREADIKEWLDSRIPASDYLFMPTNASGKYKDHWNWIYFKKKEQAALFKLVWG